MFEFHVSLFHFFNIIIYTILNICENLHYTSFQVEKTSISFEILFALIPKLFRTCVCNGLKVRKCVLGTSAVQYLVCHMFELTIMYLLCLHMQLIVCGHTLCLYEIFYWIGEFYQLIFLYGMVKRWRFIYTKIIIFSFSLN